MLAEVNEIQWDVVCLSETRAADGNYTLENGHRLFCARNEFIHAGVSILVNARWKHSILQFGKVSDRVAYVDLCINNKQYRIIAVYVPHGGYDQHCFDYCFDHIRQTILEGQRLGMQCMIGGDFNSELNRGVRGDKLQQLLCEVGLVVCNDISSLPFDDAWTFSSCLGVKRTLDYCMASSGLCITSARAINDLVLRSDHRAVQSCILLPCVADHRRRRRRKRRLDWEKYQAVAKNYVCDPSGGLGHFEKQLGDLVQECEDTSNASSTRPWDSAELRHLRRLRKNAQCAEERKKVSKQIWRLTRQGLRTYRTQQGINKLQEFRKLEQLQKLHMYPITKTHRDGPNLEACATLLQQVFTGSQHVEYETNYTVRERERERERV